MAREKRPNRGSEQLCERFPNHGDQTKIATAAEVDVSVVSRWMSGACRPDAERRAKLEELYGIGWRLWDEPVDEPAAPTASGPGEPTATDDATDAA